MPSFVRAFTLLLAFTASIGTLSAAAPARSTLAFDADWRFQTNDQPGAEKPDFGDAGWRAVNLPHDWSIEGPFSREAPTRGSGGFLPSGIGWYRKTFTLPADAAQRRVFIEFDGVMQDSDVWVNGQLLGHRPFGYVSFRYEMTPHLKFGSGATNVLAVRTDTSKQPASRWYSGAGIYRHVRLIITDPVHVEQWSTFVSTPKVAADTATVRIETSVVNQGLSTRDAVVRFTIFGPDGKRVASAEAPKQSLQVGANAPFSHEFMVSKPKLWDLKTPHLYRAVVEVQSGRKVIDNDEVTFGIREARFDSKLGFLLNGRKTVFYGVCLHHDGGAFGAAVPLAVWELRLNTLRTLGVNAIRTAHNPADPGFLDLCDRMGFLVMDEFFDCWTFAKNPHDYHLFFKEWSKIDLRDTVRRDRNHPSIVFYSAGNEIHDTRNPELAKQILAGLVEEYHRNDPTRPVTQALFRPNATGDYKNGLADLLDVVGTNYRDPELLVAWQEKPTRKIVGTEQRHDRETWLALRDNPQHAGQFLWSGIDYLGEAWMWPSFSHDSGLLDRTGGVKPIALERRSWWGSQPTVGIVRRVAPNEVSIYDPGYEPATFARRRTPRLYADWSSRNPQPHDENVEIYSNCESVELFLNGASLGAKPINADASPRTWTVPFSPGTLRAVGRNGGRDVAADELTTAGEPARVVLTAHKQSVSSDWEDVVRITATVVDEKGVRVPWANNVISFSVEGPGVIVAADNADNGDPDSFHSGKRKAYLGTSVAFVRATAQEGKMTIRATTPDLAPGTVSVTATAKR